MNSDNSFFAKSILIEKWRWASVILFAGLLIGCVSSLASAAAPDLTTGGVPSDTLTVNLGPTGLRGWVYHLSSDTAESRQIQVTAVDAGSPAAATWVASDVILGASGTGAAPVNFSADARKSLALAIADAEARTPATLNLIRWRSGTTSTVQITLRTMGSYSSTAPYNCPKSAKILKEGLQYTMSGETAGLYSFGTLSLLAANDLADPDNAARMARAQTEARALIPSAATIAQLKSGVRDTGSTWQRGHTLIVLAEYYLLTKDAQVLPAIEAYAVDIAKNQSLFGTVGHIFAEKNPDGSDNGPMGGVYGVVNSTGVPCFFGLLLAKQCGLTNPELEPAIARTSRFFAYYAHRGAIPYGEHEPYWQGHENNGKSGLAALAFELQANRVDEGKFFAKMSTASVSEREIGHTGCFFNYLWAPLGAAAGGEEAVESYFRRTSWRYDLARRWNGSFAYDCLYDGPNSGSEYNDFRMSTAALLTYALPLRQLHMTGSGHDLSRDLSSADVSGAEAVDGYDATSRSTSQLITDLGSWSPKVQRLAGDSFATRTVNSTTISQITSLANDPVGSSRVGACYALGRINDSGSANTRAATLAGLLKDSQNHVRFMSAEGMRYLPQSARLGQLTAILDAAASTGATLLPYNEEDPLHFAHARMGMLLFYSGNAYGPKGVIWGTGINGVDRSHLYPAIRAVAAIPTGLARSSLSATYPKLNAADVNALADTIVDSIRYRAPGDKMFSSGVRQGGIQVLEQQGIAEGVPLSKIYPVDDGRDSVMTDALGILKNYAGTSTTVVPNPDVIGFCKSLLSTPQAVAAQAVLDAIAADSNPTPLTPFKSIQSVTADAPAFNLPATQTILHVNSTDFAKGNSIYTWRKIHGAGAVTFTPNGDGNSSNSSVHFDGTPGRYLFEVKMSDSRGLTEVYHSIAVTLYNPDGTLPTNAPPTANAQSTQVVQNEPTAVTLTGTDPEGYALVYAVTSQPIHGSLSGVAPNLLYTPASMYTGSDSFAFNVMDSEGQLSSATINITVTPAPTKLAIYEPFAYPAGLLNGASGASEIGFTGAWYATTANVLAANSAFGAVPTLGNSIGNLSSGTNHFGGSRSISTTSLAANGLLANGATLWFSVIVGYGTYDSASKPVNVTNARLALALANNKFITSNYNYNITNNGAQLGSGLGLTLGRFNSGSNGIPATANGYVMATDFRDPSTGSGYAGNVFGTWAGTGTLYGAGQSGLIVGKITWGATPSNPATIQLYQPGADLAIPATPISTLTVVVDQSTFNTLTWTHGDEVVMDEIRFGPNYPSVLFGTVPLTPDLSPPTPSPLQWAAVQNDPSETAITLTAVTAADPSGVQYNFTCTAGGGHDSGWQDSSIYTDTGLTPLTTYSYTVKARDKSPAGNQTSTSSPLNITTDAADTIPPQPDPMGWDSPPTALGQHSITMTADVASDPNGVEYYFTNITISNGSHNSGWQDATTFVDTGLSSGTQYSYTVRARDKSAGRNQTAPCAVASAFTQFPQVTVPNVLGMPQASAESDIVAANLTVGTVTSENSASIPVGDVINQNPSGGASADENSAVALVVSIGPKPPAYASWSSGALFSNDANGDGVKNGIAWALGAANPSDNAIGLLPTLDSTSDPVHFIFTYRRRAEANSDPDTTIALEYSSDGTAWITAVDDGLNIAITETADFYGTSPAVDKVEVKLKRNLAVGGKLFLRIKVATTSQD